MKGKQLAVLLGLVVVLGAAGYFVQKRTQSAWSTSSGSAGGKILEFPINDVATLRIQSAESELNLVKKGEEWTVKERADYPANFEQVSSLLRKLWELKTVQEVKVGASQMPRLELVEPGKGEKPGTLIEFKDKDGKNLSAALLGKKHLRKSEGGPMGDEGFPTGRYVMAVGANRVSLVSETLEAADPKPERWLRKDFFKIESPKTITVAGQTDAMRWQLSRESATGEWKLADAKTEEQLDPTKTSSFASIFASASFKDVLSPDAKPEETGLDKPATVTIETFDGFSYMLKIGKLTNEAYPLLLSVSANLVKERPIGKDEKPEDKAGLDADFQAKLKKLEEKLAAEKKFEGRPYLVERFAVDSLLKDRAALLAEKKPDPATTSAPTAPGAESPSATTAPISATTPPVTVTTPPLSAPPAVSAPAQPVAESVPAPTVAAPTQPAPAPAPAAPPVEPSSAPAPPASAPESAPPAPVAPVAPPVSSPAAPVSPAEAPSAPDNPAPPKP